MYKRISIILITLSLVLITQGLGLAQVLEPWVDVWTQAAHFNTNLEKVDFNAVLGRWEARVGLRMFDLYPYVVCCGALSQDPNYWNNNYYCGIGIRLKPFTAYTPSEWWRQWVKDVKFFAESLSIGYLKDAQSAQFKPTADWRIGADLWHEWNQLQFHPYKPVDYSKPWAEVWSHLAYRETNFYDSNFRTVIFYFQPKIGIYSPLIGLEPYLKTDLVISGREEDYWLNILSWGAGVRLRPFKYEWLSKLKIFVEILGVSYLKNTPDPPQKVNGDVRLGIEFSYGR